MKKLYRILVRHCAPKDCHESIETYLIANSGEEVYEWLKNNKLTGWDYREEDEETFDIYDDNYSIIGTEGIRVRMLRLGGDYFDENADYSDLYYGVTHYGWELVQSICFEEQEILETMGIAEVVK